MYYTVLIQVTCLYNAGQVLQCKHVTTLHSGQDMRILNILHRGIDPGYCRAGPGVKESREKGRGAVHTAENMPGRPGNNLVYVRGVKRGMIPERTRDCSVLKIVNPPRDCGLKGV